MDRIQAPPRSGHKREEAPASRLTPEDWIAGATEVLIDSGIDRIRVDVLAKKIGVSRGSFYWHFQDRNDLLMRVLNTWRIRATEQIIARFNAEHRDPREAIRALLTLPLRGRTAQRAARIELAIRAWARRDTLAKRAVADIDARRTRFITECFAAMGFTANEARCRAFLVYASMTADALLQPVESVEAQNERRAMVERLLVQSPAASG